MLSAPSISLLTMALMIFNAISSCEETDSSCCISSLLSASDYFWLSVTASRCSTWDSRWLSRPSADSPIMLLLPSEFFLSWPSSPSFIPKMTAEVGIPSNPSSSPSPSSNPYSFDSVSSSSYTAITSAPSLCSISRSASSRPSSCYLVAFWLKSASPAIFCVLKSWV